MSQKKPQPKAWVLVQIRKRCWLSLNRASFAVAMLSTLSKLRAGKPASQCGLRGVILANAKIAARHAAEPNEPRTIA